VRESGRLGKYLRVFSYRGVLCKSVEVQGRKVKFLLILMFFILFYFSKKKERKKRKEKKPWKGVA
jgi:hypothetical protein